jgi:hypothetical protein
MATVARSAVNAHPVVSHEAWLAARQALLVKEKEFTLLRDELSQERRAIRCRPGWGLASRLIPQRIGAVRRFYSATEAWKEAGPFFAQSSMQWATFLLSLRDYAETGQGRPFANHVRI